MDYIAVFVLFNVQAAFLLAVNQLTVIVFHLGSLTTRTLLKNRGVADEIATDPVGVSHYQRVKL